MNKPILILTLFVVLSGCEPFNKETDNEPRYAAAIAWDSGLLSNAYYSHTVDGDAVFFYERPPGYETVNIYTLTRLSAETGELAWRNAFYIP